MVSTESGFDRGSTAGYGSGVNALRAGLDGTGLLLTLLLVWAFCNIPGWYCGARWNPLWDAAVLASSALLIAAGAVPAKSLALNFLSVGLPATLDFLRFPPELVISFCTSVGSPLAALGNHFLFFPVSTSIALLASAGAALLAHSSQPWPARLSLAAGECLAMMLGMVGAMALLSWIPPQLLTSNALIAAMGLGMVTGSLFRHPTIVRGVLLCFFRPIRLFR